jgi:hypothetical protein
MGPEGQVRFGLACVSTFPMLSWSRCVKNTRIDRDLGRNAGGTESKSNAKSLVVTERTCAGYEEVMSHCPLGGRERAPTSKHTGGHTSDRLERAWTVTMT